MNEPGAGGVLGPNEGVPASFSDWKAKNWPELRRTWKELAPEYYENSPDHEPMRRFRKFVVDQAQAGQVFERWVMEAFRLAGYVTEPGWSVPGLRYSSPREQIDGLVIDGWQAFLVESKFWKEGVDYAPIAILSARGSIALPGAWA